MRLTRLALIWILGATVLSHMAYAVDNVRKATLMINGNSYTFPIGNKEREMDVYWIRKYSEGDKTALDMILAGEEQKVMYIGDDYPCWLTIKKDGMEIS